MYTRNQCQQYVGQWVQFRTPWGMHKGVIERVTDKDAIVLSPRPYVPAQLVSTDVTVDEMKRLDVALAFWGGFGPGGFGGYGPGPAIRGGYGYPRYGFGGWARWAVSFLVIYALWGLLIW